MRTLGQELDDLKVGSFAIAATPDGFFATGMAEGGEITAPLAETFFSPMFGMCVDKFGIPWMVNAEAPESS